MADSKYELKKSKHLAHKKASAQEAHARELLWEQIREKAAKNFDFRQQLRSDPEKAVEREAAEFMRSADAQKVDAQVLEAVKADVTDQARREYRPALPGIDKDEVKGMIFKTIEDIRKSFKLTLWLSQVLFYTGLAMMIAAFVVALASDEKVTSLLFGSGGIVSVIISSLLMDPLNRVQNAAGNLIQLQMAYLAYYKQLTLLGGEDEALPIGDALKYAEEVDKRTVSLMSHIQKFVETTRTKTAEDKAPAGDQTQPTGDKSQSGG